MSSLFLTKKLPFSFSILLLQLRVVSRLMIHFWMVVWNKSKAQCFQICKQCTLLAHNIFWKVGFVDSLFYAWFNDYFFISSIKRQKVSEMIRQISYLLTAAIGRIRFSSHMLQSGTIVISLPVEFKTIFWRTERKNPSTNIIDL